MAVMQPNRETAGNVAAILLAMEPELAAAALKCVMTAVRRDLHRDHGWTLEDANTLACDFGDMVVDELRAMAVVHTLH